MGRKDSASKRGFKERRGCERSIRTEHDIEAENRAVGDFDQSDEDDDLNGAPTSMPVTISMWEFGQNDPKR
jgi:hypothetical protein